MKHGQTDFLCRDQREFVYYSLRAAFEREERKLMAFDARQWLEAKEGARSRVLRGSPCLDLCSCRQAGEQNVDTLHTAAGVFMDVEELTFDPDGRRRSSNRLTLGTPRRAWMFASPLNRKRPCKSFRV